MLVSMVGSAKIEKQDVKIPSSNNFTGTYKTKVESVLQRIQRSCRIVNPQQNIVSLTPAILETSVDKSMEKHRGKRAYMLSFNA